MVRETRMGWGMGIWGPVGKGVRVDFPHGGTLGIYGRG